MNSEKLYFSIQHSAFGVNTRNLELLFLPPSYFTLHSSAFHLLNRLFPTPRESSAFPTTKFTRSSTDSGL